MSGTEGIDTTPNEYDQEGFKDFFAGWDQWAKYLFMGITAPIMLAAVFLTLKFAYDLAGFCKRMLKRDEVNSFRVPKKTTTSTFRARRPQ